MCLPRFTLITLCGNQPINQAHCAAYMALDETLSQLKLLKIAIIAMNVAIAQLSPYFPTAYRLKQPSSREAAISLG